MPGLVDEIDAMTSSVSAHHVGLRASALAVAALTGALIVGIATPAFAATTDVSLKAALADPSTTLITLENDVTIVDSSIPVNATAATLDLAGFHLITQNITLASGVSFTIESTVAGGSLAATAAVRSEQAGITATNATLTIASGSVMAHGASWNFSPTSKNGAAGIGGNGVPIQTNNGNIFITGGTVVAVGGDGGAGIGGGQSSSGSNIFISGGTVTATGGQSGAGIGGGTWGNGGTGDAFDITVSGGNVTANGGRWGAGIGGGATRAASRISFTGGNVTANGGEDAAGIGSGQASPGGSSDISIGAGSTVTANPGARVYSSGLAPSAIGNGTGSAASGFTLGGILHADTLLLVGDTTTIAATGLLDGTATVTGGGGIANHGTIASANVVDSADTAGGVTVTDHNYVLTFIDNGGSNPNTPVRVYATSMAAGARSVPAFVRPGWNLTGWVLAGNVDFTTASTFSADTNVYANWFPGTVVNDIVALDLIPTLGGSIHHTPITGGQTLNFIGQPLDASNNNLGYLYTGVTYTTTDPQAIVTGTHIEFRTAGAHTVTGTIGTITGTLTVTVLAGPADDVTLELSATTVKQGTSLTFESWTVDAFGNRIANVSSSVVVTSDQPTDVVTGTTVTFPHASPHVLTATLGAFSASVLVQVSPAALAATGVNLMIPLLLALALLLLGAALLLWRVLRARRA